MTRSVALQPSGADALADPAWWVVCLCAGWCGACREYRPLFDALAAEQPGMRFVWVDVEDDADLVGDLDVETFPTLLIADGRQARFLGPLLPQPQVLARLLQNLQAGAGGSTDGVAQEVFEAVRQARGH